MNLNTKVQYRSTHPTKVAEASSAENAKGTSVTSMPSTSTEGLSVDSGVSGYTPPRTASIALDDNHITANSVLCEEHLVENEPDDADSCNISNVEQKIKNIPINAQHNNNTALHFCAQKNKQETLNNLLETSTLAINMVTKSMLERAETERLEQQHVTCPQIGTRQSSTPSRIRRMLSRLMCHRNPHPN